MKRSSIGQHSSKSLFHDVLLLIEQTRERVSITVNAGLVILYWQIGKRIQSEIFKGGRADYGERILQMLSLKLEPKYGRGFSARNLANMVKIADTFPNLKILQTLSAKLSWSHFVELIYLKGDLKRAFYAEICRIETWSVRTLREKIAGMLYERTALSKKPEKLIRYELKKLKQTNRLTPDLAFRDPYFLDFLGLRGAYQEKDFEASILREMESFILELGVGFAFLERQKRMAMDGQDFYLDLLFYHRELNRLVAIELKLGKFQPAYKGQMELYLRWLAKYEKKDGEELPIGLILCAGKSDEQIELLELGKSGIQVSQYLTELPSRKILEKKLHQAIKSARERFKLI